MQTNLHRVSEFAVTTKERADDAKLKPESRYAIKRLREHDNDTESEMDDTINSSSISATLQDSSSEGVCAPDPWHDSLKSEVEELNAMVFLSFDWENEEPYAKAIERYITAYSLSFQYPFINRWLTCLVFSVVFFVFLLHMIET